MKPERNAIMSTDKDALIDALKTIKEMDDLFADGDAADGNSPEDLKTLVDLLFKVAVQTSKQLAEQTRMMAGLTATLLDKGVIISDELSATVEKIEGMK